MNEEACLTSELEQPHKQLRQARGESAAGPP